MFDSLKKMFTKSLGQTSFNSSFLGGLFGNSLIINAEDYNDAISLEKYNTSLLVHTCMSKISTVFASADIDLYMIKNIKGETEKIESHPVLDILYRPNPINTKSEFMEATVTNIVLAGETFIRVIRDDAKNPIGLINIRPDIVEVSLKDGKIIYTTYVNGEKQEYTNSEYVEIIHIKKYNPMNPLRGVGVLSPIINRVTAEAKAIALQNILFTNQGRPDGILWAKGMPADQADELKSSWFNTFMGRNSKNRIAVFGGESEFKYQQISFTQQEMQMIENLKALRDDIAMAFGVPKSLMTTDDVNLANADAGYKQFINFTIKPLLVLFEETMNERFIEPSYNEALFIKHEEMVTEDRKMVLDELAQGTDKWITINEARKKTGLDPIDGGDVLYRPAGTTPIENLTFNAPTPAPTVTNAFKGRPYLYNKFKKRAEIVEKISDIIYKKTLETDIFSYEPIKKAYVKGVHNSTDRNIADFENEIGAFFLQQGKRIAKKYQDTDESATAEQVVSAIFDSSSENKALKDLSLKKYITYADRTGNAGRMPLKTIMENNDKFVINQAVINILEKRATFFAENANSVTWKKIKNAIVDGMENGEGRDVIARSIKKLFSDMSTTRAKTIAQTEGTVVSNIGLQESFKQSPVVVGKKWLSAGDDKVRPEHAENDNEIVDKDGAFSNGEHYPGEHSINCRCVIAPTIK